MSTRDENMVAALRRERAAYVAQGKDNRVQQVDDQLRRLGVSAEPDEDDGPQDRTPADPAQQTADQNPGTSTTAGSDESTPSAEAGTTAADDTTAAPPEKKTGTTRRTAAKE
ncbi:hypothetical protein ACFWED_10335 [Streptomyces anulatus]|uniref:hypothetical protein n=1 Tax=Streptomyces anulatus TaxID=1892 RepID=UPI003654A8B5